MASEKSKNDQNPVGKES